MLGNIVLFLYFGAIWYILGLLGMSRLLKNVNDNMRRDTFYVLSILGPVVWLVVIVDYLLEKLNAIR